MVVVDAATPARPSERAKGGTMHDQPATDPSPSGSRIGRRAFLGRGALGIAALGASGGLLAACSSGGSGSGSGSGSEGGSSSSGHRPDGVTSATPKPGGHLVFGTEAEETGFNPVLNDWDTTGVLYARTVFDPLAALAADGTVKPYLAQSITPNADYSVWTITMRPNLVFHDNTPCDANAVAYNFAAHQASALQGPALTNIASVKVTGPLTVAITMHEPWVPFPYYLVGGIGGQIAYIASPAMLKSTNGGSSNPKGTGPFVFEQWVPNDHFSATRNPHYWRSGLPYLDSIEYRPIPDSQQLYNSLRTHSVDIMHTSASEQTKELEASTGFAYINDLEHLIGEPDMDCVLLNCAAPPFDDHRLRQAAAMAVSSAEYCKVINLNVTPPSNGPFTKGSPYYGPTGYPAPDMAKAAALVKEVKASGKPVSATIHHTPGAFTTKASEFLQQQLQQAGMQITLQPVQQNQLIVQAVTGQFQAQTWRQFNAVDPDLNYIWWSTSTIKSGFALNFARNSDPAIEAALQKGRRSSDPSTRAAAYQTVAARLGADVPYLWTARTVWSMAAWPNVQDFNNPTLPSGQKAYGMSDGFIFPTEVWLGS